MSYSIIIPYRDRKKHLEILLPVLIDRFKNYRYEIIISEQNNNDNFQIACVENVGFKHAQYDTVVFHQVDYIPTENVSYEVLNQPVLPVRVATFVNDNLTERDYFDIPSGYRKFSTEVDVNFYGGVVCLSKKMFLSINGFNPLYKGWGNEDEDLRERLKWAGYTPTRNNQGSFICLYHQDNGDMHNKPIEKQKDFIEGRKIYERALEFKNIGYSNMSWDEEVFYLEGIENVKWVKSTNYKVNENNL